MQVYLISVQGSLKVLEEKRSPKSSKFRKFMKVKVQKVQEGQSWPRVQGGLGCLIMLHLLLVR